MLEKKVAIVTGAASGIGLKIAESFAKAHVQVIMADINEERLEKESQRIGAYYFKTDLSKKEDCKSLVDYALGKFSKVDILVNVAGIQTVSPIEDFPEDKWDFMISLMLTAPFLLTKYVWNSMKEQNWGRIINLNSIHGLVASKYKSAYVSAKHGLGGLTKTAALEGGAHGITVNSICPSYVRTPLVDNQIEDQAKSHGISAEKVIHEIMLEKAAVKKLIDPSNIAEVTKFLCSDAAACISGSMMSMDGGWTAS
ncbi:3-hydroxybutyrate dehydrogenase [Crassaminicella profunda]|uniref:3-hydroxybutyrate dehydrogenase n=1 Tax=Crassaminicella profunda TaxID=1286698 RepID=UPI001CA6C568|nr:3-hydroxybutyrate dehydrogenase [Crassaminicella profunda]QZY54395.1 3-hydroxybutyrate dehydrogenase [Crassaminicella profunda]